MTIGDGTVTTYTFGQDLYDDMLAAIASAEQRILFESYIWKADDTGEVFKQALSRAAGRGVEVYAVYDGFANLVVSPLFKRFGPRLKVLEYPVYNAAGGSSTCAATAGTTARSWSSTTGGVRRRLQHGSAYATEWRDTHVRLTGPVSGTSSPHLRGLLEPGTGGRGTAPGRCCWRRRPTGSPGSGCTATCRGCGCSRSARWTEAVARPHTSG